MISSRLPPTRIAPFQLADGAPVKLTTENGRTFLNVSRPMIDPMATVVVVEFEGAQVQK